MDANREAPERLTGLLHYRTWTGEFRSPIWSIWPIARVSLGQLFRRKLFWALYALSLIFFMMFFFGQYLLAFAQSQMAEKDLPDWMIESARDGLRVNGTADTYHNFFQVQGSMVMVVLALAGSVLVGNDFHFGSLPFYLSKPLGAWHYLLGKCLAVAVFVNLMTTIPALILFVQYGLLTSWSYFWDRFDLLVGIVNHGLILTVFLSLMVVAVASWLRRTVPLIMAWTTAFAFFPRLARALVELPPRGLGYDPAWRLIDLWNDTRLLGDTCLGLTVQGRHPEVWQAAVALGVVCVLCLSYLTLRIRAVEIVK